MTCPSDPAIVDRAVRPMQLHVLIHCNQRQPDVTISSKKAVLGIYTDVDVAYEHGQKLCLEATLRDDVFVYQVLSFELDAEPLPTTYFSQRYFRVEDEKRLAEQAAKKAQAS